MISTLVVMVMLAQASCSLTDADAVPRPTIAGYGDSIMAGAGSGDLMGIIKANLGINGSAYYIKNYGVSGETAAQIASRVVAGAATSCGGRPCAYCVIQGGVNSIKGAGAISASATMAHMTPAVDAARVVCKRVVWLDILPFRGWALDLNDAATQQRAKDYNTLMTAECASRSDTTSLGQLRCFFAYSTMEDPSNATYLLPAYTVDGLHLSPTGGGVYAVGIVAALLGD